MDISKMRENWTEFVTPLKAVMPSASNGYLEILDGRGRYVCTCYTNNPSHNATGIAAAINLIFGEGDEKTETDEQPADETEII